MRIAHLGPVPPEASGIADYAEALAAALRERGLEVAAHLPRDFAGADARGIRGAARQLAAAPVDLYHFELGGGRVRHFLLLRELLRLGQGRPITATVHDPERLAWRGWGLGRFERLPRALQQGLVLLTEPLSRRRERTAAGALHRLVVLTPTGAAGLRRWARLPAARVSVIPHGVAAVPYAPPPALPPLRVLCFGFLHPGKGIEDLLDALVWLRRQAPAALDRLQLTIAGGSRPAMLLNIRGDYPTRLRASIAGLGLGDKVQVLTDIPAAALADLVAAHHLLTLPYRDSRKLALLGRQLGASGALGWAVACGRGALVSDARALAGEVGHGNGAAVPQRDPAALGAALAELAEAPQRALAWAEASVRLARERTWAQVAARFERMFTEVLAEPRVQP